MILAIFPLLLIPFLVVLIHIFEYYTFANETIFMFYIALMIMIALSLEMFKSAFYVVKGHLLWIDFISSLALMVGVIAFLLLNTWQVSFYPLILILVASVMEVIFGFFISISNARRDIGIS